MAYMSELTDKLVADVEGEPIGHLIDLIAVKRGDIQHPEIAALVVKRHRGNLLIPYDNVAVLLAPAIPLNKRLQDIVPYQPTENDIYLARDVLDKQIIDTNGMRVVRVNDLELARVNGHFYIANLDIGSLGLLRRLGFARLAQNVSTRFGRKLRSATIAWHDTEMLPGDQPMRLKVPSDKITDLHPADLAEIISDLSPTDSSKLLETLDIKTVADTLEEVEPDFQASLVEDMADEKVADVLEEMAPDAAADLLAELPEERSQELLKLMEHEEAQDVRELLTFPEDSAGGVMNTEYVAIRPNLTAEQVIDLLRETAHEAETIFYLYVTDEEEHLLGVFSLQTLVLANPKSRVDEFMHHRMVSVKLTSSQEDVAQIVAKYNLLAVPVVDDEKRMRGIVTADDALDKILPTAWKKRLPRLYH
jgi:CBS domain-containing protein/sporulation protein YlmC with PRC-barrel domain